MDNLYVTILDQQYGIFLYKTPFFNICKLKGWVFALWKFTNMRNVPDFVSDMTSKNYSSLQIFQVTQLLFSSLIKFVWKSNLFNWKL